jgi:hypothetical protein
MIAAVDAAAQTALLNVATTVNKGLMSAQSMVKLGYLGEQIDYATLAAATTYTTPAWSVGQYREINIVCRTTGGMLGGAPVKITFNGDVTAAHYETVSRYTFGDLSTSANSQFAAAAGQLALTGNGTNVPDMLLLISVVPTKMTSGNRPFMCEFQARGSTNAAFIMGTSRGYWLDTTSDMTYLTIPFGAAATGAIEVFGKPA